MEEIEGRVTEMHVNQLVAEIESLRTQIAQLHKELAIHCACTYDERWSLTDECQEHREIRAQLAQLQEERMRHFENGVCDQLFCKAAIVRRDDGSRVCAAGHESRWVLRSQSERNARERERAAARQVFVIFADTDDGTLCDAFDAWLDDSYPTPEETPSNG